MEDEEDAENDIVDASQQSYYCPPVNSHLIMEFEEKAYLVLVEKVYPLIVEIREHFYEAWDNGENSLQIRRRDKSPCKDTGTLHVPSR